MYYLFEKDDSLNNPIECFVYDAAKYIFPVKQHWHYFAEVVYMLRGMAGVTADDKEFIVQEGDLVLIYPSSVHSMFSLDGNPPAYAVLKYDTAQFASISSYTPSLSNIYRYAHGNNMPIYFESPLADELDSRRIFDRCINELKNYRYGFDVVLRAQISMLNFGIIRHWIDSGLDIRNCPAQAENTAAGIENIAEYIDSHLAENVKVNDIAAQCHMSYSAFAAKFREHYGISCKEYIERMRIYKAEELLLFTDWDISFIAQEVGFSDSSHFINAFKSQRELTPKQFRLRKKRS